MKPNILARKEGGKAGPPGQSDLDAKVNWSMRAATTVSGPTSLKPATAPYADVGRNQGPSNLGRLVPPVDVPLENYYGLSQPAQDRMQYIRSFQDRTPYTLRRYQGDVSGVSNVQLRQPHPPGGKIAVLGLVQGYLWASVPRIPGQTRGDFGGFHMRGVDPLNYSRMWNSGPGSQPRNPGGPAKIAGKQYMQPGMVGGVNNSMYGAGS
jgi:hypothetical protein